MTLLNRYFLNQFIRYFIVLTVGLTVFFASIHFIDHVHLLFPYDPGFVNFAVYFLLILPKYFIYLLPMSTLICSLLTFALASKRKEIIAFKASGGDIKVLLIPFVAAGIIIGMIDFGVGEYVTPFCNEKLKNLEFRIKEDRERVRLKQGNIWIRGKGGVILHADTYIGSDKALRKVVVFKLKKNRPTSIISAQRAKWAGDKWLLEEIKKYDFIKREVVAMKEVAIGGLSKPDVLSKGITTPEEMGIVELLDYRKRLVMAGYKNSTLDVDIFSRMTYPFTCLFMMLIGLSISLKGHLQSGVLGVVAGVIISLVYWFLYTFMLSLGYAGVMSPAVSVGMAPTVFTVLSILMIRRIPR